jgi:hypothetical protein
MSLQAALHLRIDTWIQVVVQFLQELLTSEQKRLPLSA